VDRIANTTEEVPTMTDRYHGTKEYFLILAELIQTARYRGTVTYQELADLVGLPLVGSFMGNELGGYLGAISEDEVQHGRPMLSALTVTVEGKPGDGFFALAKDLGKLKSDHPYDRDAFWEAEKRTVYQIWQRSLHKPARE
jgi:hypothetical protein